MLWICYLESTHSHWKVSANIRELLGFIYSLCPTFQPKYSVPYYLCCVPSSLLQSSMLCAFVSEGDSTGHRRKMQFSTHLLRRNPYSHQLGLFNCALSNGIFFHFWKHSAESAKGCTVIS